MDRLLRENRKRDEYEIDNMSGSDFDSDDEDDDFLPSIADDDNDEDTSDNDDSDEEDIEPLDQSTAEETAANPQNKYWSKDKKIEYSSQPFEITRRNSSRRAENIVPGKNIPFLFCTIVCGLILFLSYIRMITCIRIYIQFVCSYVTFLFYCFSGPKAVACANIVDPLTAFLLFLKPVEHIILNMTNLYGVRKYKDQWENIDLVKLHAYFGLLLLAGVYRSYGECVTQLWNEKTGRPIFRAAMSLKMFKKIHGCIRFDDREERLSSTVRDKLAPIRNVFDRWNSNLKCMYTPGKNVTVDEQLIPFRGRCPFRQYIPSKPAKYGIKMWILCDSSNYYAYNTQVYIGRDRNTAPERNQGQRIVLDLTEGLSNRNVTCDNFFTSYTLAEKLNRNHMTILGTIRKNRNEIPPVLLDMRRKPLYSTEVVYEPKLQAVMLSYVTHRNRFVCLLSTYHNKVNINERNEKKKPNLIEDYNKTKNGVDTMDQMVATYTCKRKINRWPMALFCNLLDVSALNAFVLFVQMFPEWQATKTNMNIRRRLFIEQLGMSLVDPYIAGRPSRPRTSDAAAICDEGRPFRHLTPTTKRGRCYVCTYKNNKNTYATRCGKCAKYICAEHHFDICPKCGNK